MPRCRCVHLCACAEKNIWFLPPSLPSVLPLSSAVSHLNIELGCYPARSSDPNVYILNNAGVTGSYQTPSGIVGVFLLLLIQILMLLLTEISQSFQMRMLSSKVFKLFKGNIQKNKNRHIAFLFKEMQGKLVSHSNFLWLYPKSYLSTFLKINREALQIQFLNLHLRKGHPLSFRHSLEIKDSEALQTT